MLAVVVTFSRDGGDNFVVLVIITTTERGLLTIFPVNMYPDLFWGKRRKGSKQYRKKIVDVIINPNI